MIHELRKRLSFEFISAEKKNDSLNNPEIDH